MAKKCKFQNGSTELWWDYKSCIKCGAIKSMDKFTPLKKSIDGCRNVCKICKNYSANKFYYKHHKRLKEERDKIRPILKERDDRYKIDNYEMLLENRKKYFKENREKCLAATRKWRKENLAYDAARKAKRRAMKLQATPQWANFKYIDLFYLHAGIETERTGRKVHVDHIVPLKGKNVCGFHCEDNLQLMFAEDNWSKGNRFG